MKYCLFLLLIFFGTSFNRLGSAEKYGETVITCFSIPQQEPFYFNKPIPSKIKILDKVDLSFFRNPLITSYRYRLEIPIGRESTINKKLILWSSWTEDDFADIAVPRLDLEGSYKLIIEYKTRGGSETKKLEKLFSVYIANSPTNPVITKAGTVPVTDKVPAKKAPSDKTAMTTTIATDKSAIKTASVTGKLPSTTTPATEKVPTGTISIDKKVTKTAPVTDKITSKTSTLTVPASENLAKEKVAINDKKLDLENGKNKEVITNKTIPLTGDIIIEPPKDPVILGKSELPDYNQLLNQAIEKKDSAKLNEAIENGAGTKLKGENGGNIFHILDQTMVTEDLILLLKKKGFSINEPDDYGNSPLQYAILAGENDYARSLIHQGADLNFRNKLELSPLHLAVLLNNKEIVTDLLKKGAEINLRGKNGYTPLHIASEMNYIETAISLLNNGARNSIRTDQRLSSKTIAKIQKDPDMVKLIGKKGSFTVNSSGSPPPKNIYHLNSDSKKYPEINFNLTYDNKLAKKRQFNKIVQIISIPVFTISAASTVFLRSRADHYYSLSKIAETEEIAKVYYDKTTQYDKYTYAAGGVSLVSLYCFIHSTIRKNSISNKMHKTFY